MLKNAKDIGMTIRKGIVVSFLPCLVAFWGFHPYMCFHFFKCSFVTFAINVHQVAWLYQAHATGGKDKGLYSMNVNNLQLCTKPANEKHFKSE